MNVLFFSNFPFIDTMHWHLFFFLWWWYLTSLGFVKKKLDFLCCHYKIKKICTLFPRHPMIPQPTQEMLVLRIYLQRSPRTQTDTSIPTICLLMMHWKSCTKLEASLTGYTFCLSPPLGSCSFGELERDLLSVALIREFHFMVTLLFSGPRIFLALRGTISWKLYPFIIHEISGFFFCCLLSWVLLQDCYVSRVTRPS